MNVVLFCFNSKELLRLVSSNDEDSYNTNAFYLNRELAETIVPNTPFAAMLAKQQTNHAIADANQEHKRININYGIGVPGKDSVKEVRAKRKKSKEKKKKERNRNHETKQTAISSCSLS